MTKHFEDLWEEAELVSSKCPYGDDFIDEVQKQLHDEINTLCYDKTSSDAKTKSFGRILYLLCYLSFKWNVNTFSALLRETQDRKIDMLDDE